MAKMIDLSGMKRDDIVITSMNHTQYLIPGNFEAEYSLTFVALEKQIKTAESKKDIKTQWKLLKEFVYDLMCMNVEGTYIDEKTGEEIHVTHKNVTRETIDKEFNDWEALNFLLNTVGARVQDTAYSFVNNG